MAAYEFTARSGSTPRGGWARRLLASLPDPITSIVVLTTATFALVGIGSPLVGAATFAGVDTLGHLSPQRDESMAGVTPQTINMGDTVDFSLPHATLFGEELRDGEYPQWNPYILGGVPLAATPNFALLSPVALPFWVLPGWLAPGHMKLLEIIVAAGSCHLFLRRVRLGGAAAWLGGLTFASSGYLIVWTNWPQSRVAVFIPALFWALERLIQRSGDPHGRIPRSLARRRRSQDVALVGLPVTAMLLSGFPSVTGYAVLTAGCYFLARVLAEHAGRWRRVLGLLTAGGAGVLAGVALTAFQLLPWAWFMSHTVIRGRAQGPEDHIPSEMLLTTIAPYLFGTVNPGDPPLWFHGRIFIEYSWYVGAAAILLVGIAVAAARRARALLPRGLWWFLVASSAVWMAVIFIGGPPLALLQQLPVLFSDNFVGRARSVLGFLTAALAAVGFQLLLARWRDRRHGATPRGDAALSSAAAAPSAAAGMSLPAGVGRWLARAYGIGVWLTGAAAAGALLWLSLRIAHDQNAAKNADGELPHFVTHMATELAVGAGFLAAAALCAGLLWRTPVGPVGTGRRKRLARLAPALAAGLIPVMIGAQALALALPYHPRADRAHFYPMTRAASYLREHLGHERFYGATGAIYGGSSVPHRIRALHGHIYLDRRFAELLETMPGQQFDTPPTYLNGDSVHGSVPTHPVLDRVSVSHYMLSPNHIPYGARHVAHGDGTTATLTSDRPITVSLTATGPLRAIGVTPAVRISPPGVKTRLSVTTRSAAGTVVAQARRIVRTMTPGTPFYVPVAAESLAAGDRVAVEISLSGRESIPFEATGGSPAVSTVTSDHDGLRLVYDDSSVIYRRTTVLPRARWASDVVVEPNQRARLRLLSSGRLTDDQVVLDRAGATTAGRPATVRWIHDGMDEMTLAVDAQGAGYLVVADAIRSSWAVTVDGKPAALVAADHGLAAVAVPAGEHTVRLAYRAPYHNAGGFISAVTALLLFIFGAVEWRQRRRTREPTMSANRP